MKKKIGVFALIAAIAVSAAGFSASAEDDTSAETVRVPFEVSAAFTLPMIDVTFPTSITAAINPYHLVVEKDGVVMGSTGITSPEYEITNNSDDVGITVLAKLSAYGSSGVNIVTADGTGNAPVFRNDGTEPKLVFAFLNTTTLEKGLYFNSDYKVGDKTQLAFTETAPDNFTELMRIDTSSSGYFKIQGDVVELPQTSWNAGDSVTFNIVFDVAPYNPGRNDENITVTAVPDDTGIEQ